MILDIYVFWNDILRQNRVKIKKSSDAYINWNCTNEHFTVYEFIRANCEYPCEWGGEVERVESFDDKNEYRKKHKKFCPALCGAFLFIINN